MLPGTMSAGEDEAGRMRRLESDKRGGYTLVRKLGTGGMAEVWLAWHDGQRRYYALKLLPEKHRQDAEMRERFAREARKAIRLQHAHICRVSDFQLDGAVPYYVMDHYTGGSLDERIARHPQGMPLDEALAILEQLLQACQYAHGHGIVHRDVKPENVLFDDEGRAVLSDFGLARAPEDLHLTRAGAMVGTPYYASPEQAKGHRDVDGRSDLYSLGVVLYQMLTGRLPFDGTDAMSVYQRHVFEEPAPLRTIRTDLSLDVEGFVAKAMAKEPDLRYRDARAMLVDCRKLRKGRPLSCIIVPGRRREISAPRRSRSARKGFFAGSVFDMPRARELAGMVATLCFIVLFSRGWSSSSADPGKKFESLAIRLKTRLASAEIDADKTRGMRVLVVPFQGRGPAKAAPVICERLLREFLDEQKIASVPPGEFERVFRGNDAGRIYRPEVFKMLRQTFFASHLVMGRVLGGGRDAPPTLEVKVFRLRDGRRVSYLRRKLRSFGKVDMTERYVSLWKPVVHEAL